MAAAGDGVIATALQLWQERALYNRRPQEWWPAPAPVAAGVHGKTDTRREVPPCVCLFLAKTKSNKKIQKINVELPPSSRLRIIIIGMTASDGKTTD